MIRIGIAGACGKMGRLIAALALSEKDINIGAALEVPSSAYLNQDYGLIIEGKENGVKVLSDAGVFCAACDVVIDFTAVEATLKLALSAASLSKPMIIGTTGFSDVQAEELKKTLSKVACVMSPNMSVGVNYLFKALKDAAAFFPPEYDIEIVEMHHNKKKDAPSGTAMKCAKIIAQERGLDYVYGREGMVGARKQEELGVLALRAGDVVGEHTIIFAGPGERLEFTHRAHSRSCFAAGALKAARFAFFAKPGMYSMGDVFKI